MHDVTAVVLGYKFKQEIILRKYFDHLIKNNPGFTDRDCRIHWKRMKCVQEKSKAVTDALFKHMPLHVEAFWSPAFHKNNFYIGVLTSFVESRTCRTTHLMEFDNIIKHGRTLKKNVYSLLNDMIDSDSEKPEFHHIPDHCPCCEDDD